MHQLFNIFIFLILSFFQQENELEQHYRILATSEEASNIIESYQKLLHHPDENQLLDAMVSYWNEEEIIEEDQAVWISQQKAETEEIITEYFLIHEKNQDSENHKDQRSQLSILLMQRLIEAHIQQYQFSDLDIHPILPLILVSKQAFIQSHLFELKRAEFMSQDFQMLGFHFKNLEYLLRKDPINELLKMANTKDQFNTDFIQLLTNYCDLNGCLIQQFAMTRYEQFDPFTKHKIIATLKKLPLDDVVAKQRLIDTMIESQYLNGMELRKKDVRKMRTKEGYLKKILEVNIAYLENHLYDHSEFGDSKLRGGYISN